MKTFTSIKPFNGQSQKGRRIFVVEGDSKRKGLYKMSEYRVIDNEKTAKFSMYYGKCNQSTILECTKDMIEVPE